MPLKFTNSKAFLKILWTNEDKSRTATFVVHKEMSETEQIQELLKAVGFLGVQAGIVPPMASGAGAVLNGSAPMGPAESASQGFAATTPGPSGPRISMMPPASLTDRPSDGGRPDNVEFWQSMPTLSIPEHLAQNPENGWEMIPPGEA